MRLRERRRRVLVRLAVVAGTLVRWNVHRMLPGMAGAAAISVGGGELAGHLLGRGLAPWVGLLLAGGFTMWIGAAVNHVPRQPRNEG